MAIVLVSKQQYLLSAVPAVLRFTDQSDYAGAGASHSDVIIGLLSVLDPSGAILYQNAHYGDVTPGSGDLTPYATVPVTFIDIPLPIDPTTNLPEQGNYTVNYRVYVHQASGTTLNGNYTIQKIYNVCPQIPLVDIDITVDCICGKYSSVDATNYGAYSALTRVHTVKYPGGVPLNPEVSALPNITAILYTGTYTSIVSSTVSFTDSNNNTVTYLVTGSQEMPISCAKSLCDVSCQIFTLQDAYFAALQTNTTMARQYKTQLDEITLLMQGITMAMDCGQTNRVNDLLNRVYTVGNFSPGGCGCDDDTPQLVSGCGNVITGNTYTMSASNGLSVFALTSGNNTEFQVKINDGLYNVLNGLTKTALVAGTNVTIVPVTSPDGSTVTYTINANVGSATISISQVTGLQAALDAKQSTTLTNAHILVGNVSSIATDVALTGDASIINTGVLTVTKINGVALGATTATNANLLIANGTQWVTQALNGDATITNAGVLTLKNTGTPGTYTSVTTDAQGRITGGTNPGFITGNQAITLSGAVTGTGTTAITTTLAAGIVGSSNMAANSVTTAAIQNGAITTAKYANVSIPTTAYVVNSVTGGVSGVLATNTITMDNMATDLKIGYFTAEVFLDIEGGSSPILIYHPFAGTITVTTINAMVIEAVAGTDNGSITFANNIGAMGAPLSIPMSSARGYSATFTAVSNQMVTATNAISITPSKATSGGRVLLTINYTRA
jgi:hypothetical protein